MAGWLQRKVRQYSARGWRQLERWRMINFNRLSEFFFEFRKPFRLRGGSRADRGRFGEARAADFVCHALGYRILARNWRFKRDEIDLVCLDGAVLVFIEVRLRRASAQVPAYYSVDKKKKKALQRVCKNYLYGLKRRPQHFRFDVIALALADSGHYDLQHYPNVPLFGPHYVP
jgi:putative endonuclease